ncbi:MAG: hypothetical protein AAGB02_08485 [Pseudomonadota bacterium]
MQRISCHQAKQNFGALLGLVKNGPIEIVKYRSRRAILVSVAEYDRLCGQSVSKGEPTAKAALDLLAGKDRQITSQMIRSLPDVIRRLERAGISHEAMPAHLRRRKNQTGKKTRPRA